MKNKILKRKKKIEPLNPRSKFEKKIFFRLRDVGRTKRRERRDVEKRGVETEGEKKQFSKGQSHENPLETERFFHFAFFPEIIFPVKR